MAAWNATTFKDFFAATVSAGMSKPEELTNDAVLQQYPLVNRLLGRQSGESLSVDGGQNLVDYTMLEAVDQSGFYDPNGTLGTVQNPNLLTKITVEWAFKKNSMGWTDHQILLNIPAGLSGTPLRDAFKKEMHKIKQNFWTTWLGDRGNKNGFAHDLWAQPEYETMEGHTTTPNRFLSIPAIVNEFPSGLFASGGSYGTTAWTQVGGINPTSSGKTAWAPQVFEYKTLSIASGFGASNLPLTTAMTEAFYKLNFVPPTSHAEYFGRPESYRHVIVTGTVGMQALAWVYQTYGSYFVGYTKDPILTHPKFNGIDIIWDPILDAAKLYLNSGSTALVAEPSIGGTTALYNGPRYYFLDLNTMPFVFNRRRFFEATEPIRAQSNQPWSWVVHADVWGNFFPKSRISQGMVRPDSTVWV